MPETSQKRKATADSVPKSMRFKRSRGKRPNKVFRKAAFNAKTLDDDGQQPMKLLPPGSFTDYLRMLQAKHPDQRFTLKLFCTVLWLALASFDQKMYPLSTSQLLCLDLSEDSLYSTFIKKINWSWNNIHVSHWDWHHAKVWGLHFSQRLAIREQSRHSTCSVCVRHRSILKRLGNDSLGRQGQLKQYMIHLQRQYADRVAYWSARSVSRLYALPCGKKKPLYGDRRNGPIRSTDFPERSWHPRRSSAGGYDQPLTSVLLLLMAITFWLLPHFLMWGRMPPLSSPSLRTVFTWSQRKRTSVQRRSSYNLTTPVEK